MADVADGKLGHYTFVLYEFASPGDFMKVLRQAEGICHARNYKFVAHLSATEEPPFDTFFCQYNTNRIHISFRKRNHYRRCQNVKVDLELAIQQLSNAWC